MGKLFAILGDIHANLDALEVVLADCREQGVTDYLCTGDVVGYNACPHECLEMVRALNCPVVMGNHDHYVSSRQNLEDFNPHAAAVIEWTRKQLSAEEMSFLQSLPFVATKMGITLVHATMDNPEDFGYVFDHLQAEAHFSHQVTPLCFHGHTHVPIIYSNEPGGVVHYQPRDFTLELGQRLFINVGSVGQPRDGDPRASYVVYDMAARQIRFRRVAYDVQTAMARNRLAGLPEKCASRLEIGR